MKQFGPGDDQYEALLRAILAHLDERQKKRWQTPQMIGLQTELNQLEDESEAERKKWGESKPSDDQVFRELKRQERCRAIRTEMDHHMDDLHQAEKRHREHRRQFEEALAKHLKVVNDRQNQAIAADFTNCD